MSAHGLILSFEGMVPDLAPDVYVAPHASVIGNVTIGAGSSIWFGTVVRGDVHEIRIGERTNIQDNSVVHVTGGRMGTYIGSDITIGHRVILHACTLEDGCFIGMGAVIMDGVVVEKGAMVAAGALVTPGKRVLAGELWAGNPAKSWRPVTPEDQAGFVRSSASYAKLAQRYRLG